MKESLGPWKHKEVERFQIVVYIEIICLNEYEERKKNTYKD